MDSNKIGVQGEEAVNRLAYHTYLKYWCYPNPRDITGDGKELCDLLIIFKSHLIIISVKNYSFGGNYERYFKSTLKKAISQLQGAERKLLNNSRKIVFNHPDTGYFELVPENYDSVHRIIVNINTEPLFHPGGLSTKSDNFAHIFNWQSFFEIVTELDTIPEFIEYLKEREIVFKSKEFIMMLGDEDDWDVKTNKSFMEYNASLVEEKKRFVLFSGSELDLLADYFFNQRKFNENFYSIEYKGATFNFDGNWDEYLSRKQVKLKKEEDKVSYFLDEFVKREVLYRNHPQNIKIATELLSLSRFERRIFGKNFFEFWHRYKNENDENFLARRYGTINDIVISLVLYGKNMPHNNVMALMQLAVEGFCIWDNYKSNKIISIAVSNELTNFKYGFVEKVEPFSESEEKEVKKTLKSLNWFQNIEEIKINYKEYPN